MKQPQYNKNMSYDLIKYMFDHGIYTAEEVAQYVKNKNITKEEFHSITGYSYDNFV